MRELCDIYYDDVDYYEPLTADDVEILLDDYFNHSYEILREFYMKGYLSDELITEYGLEYLAFPHSIVEFPGRDLIPVKRSPECLVLQ